MQITVEQAMNVYPMSNGALVAGAKGEGRVVKSVNVMDAPDIADWIKEGEMLFTTAYLIKDDLEAAKILLRKLNARGLAALGIKLGRFWNEIPPELIESANELGLPLIELPYQYTFSDLMNGLFHAEMKRNTMLLENVLERQVKLMRYALKSEPVSSLFNSIEDIIGCPIAVVGSKGQLIHNGSPIDREVLLEQWPWNHQKYWIRRRQWQALRLPFAKPEVYSGFVYFFRDTPYITPVEESLYIQAAEFITHQLTFIYADYLEQTAQKDFGLLIRQYLLNGMSVDSLSDYAERWEMNWLNDSYRCVFVEVDEMLDQTTMAEKLNELRTAMLCHSRMQELKGIHVVINNGILSIFPDNEGDEVKFKDAFEVCMIEAVWKDWHEPKVVIGSRKKKLRYLIEAYRECKNILRLCHEWMLTQKIVSQETFDLTLVFESVPREQMKKFYEHWIEDILPGGVHYSDEMYETLETYLECNGQMNETAKRLYVHRNTAAYRIEKLSEIIGVDLKQMDYVVRLKIAFLFYRMVDGKGII